jgi:hypothetical protein
MDMQTPDHTATPSTAEPKAGLSAVFARYVRHALADAVPIGPDDSQETRDLKRQAAQELFDSFDSVDPAEAQLAAIAVAASLAAMDSFARAARPGTSEATAARMRGSALAAGRAYSGWLHTLRERQPVAEQDGRRSGVPDKAAAHRTGARGAGSAAGLHRAPARGQADPRGRDVPAARPVR